MIGSGTIGCRCMSVSREETRRPRPLRQRALQTRALGQGTSATAYSSDASRPRQTNVRPKKKTGREKFPSGRGGSGRSRGGEQGGRCGCRRCQSNLSSTGANLRAFCGASHSHSIDAGFLRVNVGTVTVCSLADARRRLYGPQAQNSNQTRHTLGAPELRTRGCSVGRCSSIGRCNGRHDVRYMSGSGTAGVLRCAAHPGTRS
jgi:hypothetical protein